MAVKENQPDEAKVKKMIDDLVKKAKINPIIIVSCKLKSK